MFDPVTMLAGLLPLGVELGKVLIQKLAPDQVKPATFEQLMQLQQLQLDQWKALQGGDAPTYPWVAAVRQMQRPVFVAGVLAVWGVQAIIGEPSDRVSNMACAVGFYLFGDRTLFYVKGKPNV